MNAPLPPAVQIDNAGFLRAIRGDLVEGEHMWVAGFADDPAKAAGTCWHGRQVPPRTRLEAATNPAHNNYFSVAALTGGKRRAENFARLMVLVADDADRAQLTREPSWVLRTSANKAQIGFVLRGDDPATRNKAACIRAVAAIAPQGQVKADKSGNTIVRYVRLPIGTNTKASYPAPFAHELAEWRPDVRVTLAEALEAFGVSAEQPTDEPVPPAVTSPPGTFGLSFLARALSALDPDMGRDAWLQIGMALHHETGGAIEGLDAWDAWSAQSLVKYVGREDLETCWASFGRNGAAPVTGGTILRLATDAGWTDYEEIAKDFEDVTQAAHGSDISAALPAFKRANDTGAILATKENITWALARPDLCGYQLRHDTFRDEVMVAPAGCDEWRPFRDTDYHALCMRMERGPQGFKDIAKEKIRDAVAYVAEGNAFDSAQHWLDGLAWDGKPRIETFLPTYFGAEDSRYTRAVSLYLWTALAGRVLVPGIKADMVPAAVGPQGAMKSSTVAAIVPAPDFFLELDLGSKDDDLARLMRGKLVIELGELKGLRAKEVEHIKAFISRQHEEWVPKYREMNVRYSRRGVFFATTNQDEFLTDDTGNRRWLPFRAGRCDPEGVKAARGQLWAEAREVFKVRGVVWQEAEQLGRDEHEAFVVHDAWEPVVRAWLDETDLLTGAAPRACDFLQTHEVLAGALRFDTRNITRREEIRIGSVLQKLGYQRDRRRVNGARAYVYVPASLSVPNLSLSETG